MSDDDPSEDGEIPRLCRLFPLPGVVLFPHAVLPLHIFEPRYRQMTEDALADGDGLIVLVQVRDEESEPDDEPPLHPIACLGRILQHQRRDDGRFDFLLLGLKRVRLVREVPSDKLYRLAVVEALEDEEPVTAVERLRTELIGLFREAVGGRRKVDPELESLLNSPLSLGVLTDLLAHSLGIPAEMKQALLAEPKVERRVETLTRILARLVSPAPEPHRESREFPPPFSAN